MMTIGNLRPSRWQHDRLPDFLWLQAVREETGDLSIANDALDILDPFVPDPPQDAAPQPQPGEDGHPRPRPIDYLDGRISTFALVPAPQREAARTALSTGARWALPEELGHALALYPDGPAAWLYEDWARENHADPEIATAYLKRLVAAIYDPRGRPSSQLRLIPLARMIKHGKLFFRDGMEILDLLPNYPSRLSEEDQLHVEQWARVTSLTHLAMEDTTIADDWVTYFWRHSYELFPCELPPTKPPAVEEHDEEDEDSLQEPAGEHRKASSLSEVRGTFLMAVDELGQGLRGLQQQASIDTHETTADEVKLGLASRQFRLLRRLVADPSLWTNEMAPHLLRSMIDLRIIVAWLINQNDSELYERFKTYGQGKRKLFKLKLEDLMESEDIFFDEDDHALLDHLRQQVSQDTIEELQTIDVGGSFSGKNIREMAAETELGDLYSLNYQPLSTEAHGEWGSLIDFDLRHCGNPLHKYHRLGRFDTSATQLMHIGWVRDAFAIARETIEGVFDGYGLDSEQLLARCLEQMGQV